MVSAFMIDAIKDAGCISVASDISKDAVGKYLADEFVVVPQSTNSNLWEKQTNILKDYGIDFVFPSLDETLIGWANRKILFESLGIKIIISSPETIDIFSDKWKTFCFFQNHGIPTPNTSLNQDFPLLKPVKGRGSVGVRIENESVSMEGLVSQELLKGTEYTVDVLCDSKGKPTYVVPRIRKKVVDGKSSNGQIKMHPKIDHLVRKICDKVQFYGPINLQCFELDNGDIKFIEINPRIAGGMALSFAATQNWVEVVINHFVGGVPFHAKPIQDGKCMYRYYKEIFA